MENMKIGNIICGLHHLLKNCAEKGKLRIEYNSSYCSTQSNITHVNIYESSMSKDNNTIEYYTLILSNNLIEYTCRYTDLEFLIEKERKSFIINIYNLKLILNLNEEELEKCRTTLPGYYSTEIVKDEWDESETEDIFTPYDCETNKYILANANNIEKVYINHINSYEWLSNIIDNKEIENIELISKSYNTEIKICVKNKYKSTTISVLDVLDTQTQSVNLSNIEQDVLVTMEIIDDYPFNEDDYDYSLFEPKEEDYGDADVATERAIINMLEK